MFITVFTQVSVLMLMIAAGFIAAKTGIMTEAEPPAAPILRL